MNDGCFGACLPCPCLHASVKLALLVPRSGLASISHITMITAVANCIAACMTTVWSVSDSAILVWISTPSVSIKGLCLSF